MVTAPRTLRREKTLDEKRSEVAQMSFQISLHCRHFLGSCTLTSVCRLPRHSQATTRSFSGCAQFGGNAMPACSALARRRTHACGRGAIVEGDAGSGNEPLLSQFRPVCPSQGRTGGCQRSCMSITRPRVHSSRMNSACAAS